eukprot:TRINITY_DN10643_c0_g1_i1.p1 TRINITY_DN10643_c0_g1~~TRINITY_DN10643_c0_g1_i1.p1  ORF type:complete len:500 (-),score=105.02 TRINITY_DN10643_c0_g1_i1:4-1503(-)
MSTKRKLSEVFETGSNGDNANTKNESRNGDEKKSADEEVIEDEEEFFGDKRRRKGSAVPGSMCPYLDTINRSMLDFDFEKVCSVTLLNLNVYACLVCGKYYQGRGKNSPAHFHSLQANHHVFINLYTYKVYCLPDDYEVLDSSFDDIKYVLNPTYTAAEVAELDSKQVISRGLDGVAYIPGVVGLNNIKFNDSINTVVQSLVRIPKLRDFFIMQSNYQDNRSILVQRFGELIRKVWNPRNFKGQVSPHELLQAISVCSKKRFRIGHQSDPVEFLTWFLNTLHMDLGGGPKKHSIITKCFQGRVKVTTIKGSEEDSEAQEKQVPVIQELPFLILTLDVPPPPLFKDEQERNIIPQVPMYTLLEKYNGVKYSEFPIQNERKQYIITKMPQYLLMHIKRFTKNQWFVEKNPTIVNFPIKNLETKDCMEPQALAKIPSSQYDLLANIVHEGQPGPGKGIYKVDALHKASDKWYEIQDLMVKETMPQLIALSEAYVQFYERQGP